MRTTVEITEAQRIRLAALAATRGLRGFSLLVQEALDRYLASPETPAVEVAAKALRGQWSKAEAEEVEQAVKKIRQSWR